MKKRVLILSVIIGVSLFSGCQGKQNTTADVQKAFKESAKIDTRDDGRVDINASDTEESDETEDSDNPSKSDGTVSSESDSDEDYSTSTEEATDSDYEGGEVSDEDDPLYDVSLEEILSEPLDDEPVLDDSYVDEEEYEEIQSYEESN